MWFQIKQFITNIFGYPLNLFSRLLDTVPNGLNTFVAVFMFICFCRFILRPFLGGSLFDSLGSDRVRKGASQKSNDSNRSRQSGYKKSYYGDS